MLSPEPPSSTCARCGTLLVEDAPDGSICEACAEVTAGETMETTPADAADFTPVPPAAIEHNVEVIGDYEILGKLGQGGMGAVYRARQITLDRMVALKILPSNLQEDESFVARFQREAAVAAGLHHPNLVHVYASGCADGCHFIAMELVEGENLRQRLKRGPIPMAEAVRICLEVARALQCAWQGAHLIHRDVKPSNIYLSADGTVKLGDLGLAKSLLSNTTGLTHTGAAIGTPHYISPEQARGDKTIDLRADIYSLGCTLYELLTGLTPYRGTDPLSVMMMHVNSPPPVIMKVLPQCPMPVGRLVNKMLRKARHERHQTYAELIAAMEGVQQQLELGPNPGGPSAVLTAWREIGDPSLRSLAPAPPPKARAAPERPATGRRWAIVSVAVLVLSALGVPLFRHPRRATAALAGGREPPKAAAIGHATPPPEQWQDGLRDPWKLYLSGGAEMTPQGLRFTGKGQAAIATKLSPRNGAMRVRASYDEMRTELDASIKGRVYRLTVASDGKRVGFIRYNGATNENEVLSGYALPVPLQSGQEYELELRVTGQTLTAKLDGEVLGSIKTETDERAALGVAVVDARGAPALIRKLEVLDLDAPSAAPPAVRLSPSSEPWQDVLHDPTKLGLSGGAERTPEGLRIPRSGNAMRGPRGPKRDGAVRVLFTFGDLRLKLGVRGRIGSEYSLYCFDSGAVVLGCRAASAQPTIHLRDFALAEPLQLGRDYELELRVVGQTLTAKLNGVVLGSATDSTLSQGEFGVSFVDGQGSPVLIKALEILDLDAPASAPPAGRLSLSTEPWLDVLRDPAELSLSGAAERTPEGLRFTDTATVSVKKSEGPEHDGALRVLTTFGGVRPELTVLSADGHYRVIASSDGKKASITRYDNATKQSAVVREFPLRVPLQRGEDYEMELRVVGQALSVKVNAELLGTLNEATSLHRPSGIRVLERNAAPTLVKAIEVLDLGAPGGASSALKKEPLNNPLGGAAAKPEQWQDLLADPAVFDPKEHLQRAAQGAVLNGFCHLPPPDFADGAVRVSFVWNNSNISLVGRSSKEHGYSCSYDAQGEVWLQYREGASSITTLRHVALPTPLAVGSVAEMEFRMIGTNLSVRLNGLTVIDAADDRLAKGSCGVATKAPGPVMELRSLQFLKLDGRDPITGLRRSDDTNPSAATKDGSVH